MDDMSPNDITPKTRYGWQAIEQDDPLVSSKREK